VKTFWNELNRIARLFRRKPAFFAACTITLALALGANAVIFSVINAVLLHPLGFEKPNQLVLLWTADRKQGIDHFGVSLPYFEGWRNQNHVFEQIAAFAGQNFDLIGQSEPERVSGAMVSANFFNLLGTQPVAGRTFLPEEDNPHHSNVAVVSYELWQRRFGSETRLAGQTLATGKTNYTIIGIMPAKFRFLGAADIWVPLGAKAESLHIPSNFPPKILATIAPLSVVARLKPGVALSQAQVELKTITSGMQSAYASPWESQIERFTDVVVGPKVRRILLVLMAAVVVVLLIACVNVANLQLIHVVDRQREMAIRVALGATRQKLIYRLLAEGGIIAFTGGAAGLLIAFAGAKMLAASIPGNILGASSIAVDSRVLLFTLVATLFSLAIFGIIPALQVSGHNLTGSLREGASNLSLGVQQRKLQQTFVISQVGFASVLLVAALLMMKDLYHLSLIDLGIDPHNVLTVGISLSEVRYSDSQKQHAFFDTARERLKKLPGVTEVGLVSFLPLEGITWQWSFSIKGREDQMYPANYRVVDGDYFRAMSIPLRKGQFFGPANYVLGPDEAIINEAMAKEFWPAQDPIGRFIRMGDRTANVPWLSIVGVVADVKEVDLTGQPKPVFYVPYGQSPQPSMALVIRSETDPTNLISAVRRQILQIDPNQPVHDIRTMEDVLSSTTATSRFNMQVLIIFAGIATILALTGIYGVIGYSVDQRVHEIGIRLALGARQTQIIGMIMAQAAILILLGIGIGLLAAAGLMRFLATVLYEIKPFDPAVFLFVLLLLSAMALVASFLPLRRINKLDYMAVLRYE
jgi:putative ABC transport system permease protein